MHRVGAHETASQFRDATWSMVIAGIDPDRVRATYGENYARLVEVKRLYDPTNVFHVNQNIQV